MSTPDTGTEPSEDLDSDDLDTVAGGKGQAAEDGGYLKKNPPHEL